ncbi:MAG: ATP-binding protein, partial [Actinomycetota bacterium]|nr:ATP-binding protein [Actinomycetota bacterium]
LLDLGEVIKKTATLAAKLLSAQISLVFTEEGEKKILKAALGTIPFSNFSSIELPENEPWVKKLKRGESVREEKVSSKWLPIVKEKHLYSLAATPIRTNTEIQGYIICLNPMGMGFGNESLEILEALQNQVAAAYEKARLYMQVRDEKTKLEAIIQALRDGLIVADSDEKITQINPIAKIMLSVEEDVIGENLTRFLLKTIQKANLGEFTLQGGVKAALEGKIVLGELVLKGESESPATAQCQLIPLRGDLQLVTGILLFLHDITEFKRLDEMKSKFLSNVSHELRTPLTSVEGFVSLLMTEKAGQLNSTQKEYLQLVKEDTASLASMIDNLLELSRIQERESQTRKEKVDIREVVEYCAKRFANRALEKGIKFSISKSENIPPICADRLHMVRVINNLLDNALKFTDSGGMVSISVSRATEGIEVNISDTGRGISPSALPHIFNRFYQAESGTPEGKRGFGLGLAVSKELVELNGGSIRAESSPGSGSTFHVFLPVAPFSGREEESVE